MSINCAPKNVNLMPSQQGATDQPTMPTNVTMLRDHADQRFASVPDGARRGFMKALFKFPDLD